MYTNEYLSHSLACQYLRVSRNLKHDADDAAFDVAGTTVACMRHYVETLYCWLCCCFRTTVMLCSIPIIFAALLSLVIIIYIENIKVSNSIFSGYLLVNAFVYML